MNSQTQILSTILKFLVICMVVSVLVTTSSDIHAEDDALAQPTNTPSFEDMFKDVDFQELVKKMEKELEQSGYNPHNQSSSDDFEPSPFRPQDDSPAEHVPNPASLPARAGLVPKIPDTQIRKVFEQGIVVEQTSKGPSKKESAPLSPIYRFAYETIMEKLVDAFEYIQRYGFSSQQFSPEFKKALSGYQKDLDAISSESHLIGSHDAYLTTFFSNVAPRNELRSQILRTFDVITQLAARLPELDPEEEQTFSQSLLEEKALEQTPVPTPELIERRQSQRKKGSQWR